MIVFTELGPEDDGKLFVCQQIRPKLLKIVGKYLPRLFNENDFVIIRRIEQLHLVTI